MNSRSKQYSIRAATVDDTDFLNKVFESDTFEGAIGVQFTRRPSPYDSLKKEAHCTFIALVIDNVAGVPCGTGCCQVRTSYIGGKKVKVGYLSSMRVVPEYRQKLMNIAQVYKFIFDNTLEVDFYYTTILTSNLSVIKMLEKPRKHFPPYHKLGKYTVFCLSPRLSRELPYGYRVTVSTKIELKQYLSNQAQSHDLSTVDLLEEESAYFALRDPSDKLIGAGAVVNQQSYKQYVITHYQGIYKILPYLPTVAMGYPRVPKMGQPANYASLHSVFLEDGAEHILPGFLSCMIKSSPPYDLFMIGTLENSRYYSGLEKLHHIKYESYLYEVKRQSSINLQTLNLDVGLL